MYWPGIIPEEDALTCLTATGTPLATPHSAYEKEDIMSAEKQIIVYVQPG
jgi:hypothetical protein